MHTDKAPHSIIMPIKATYHLFWMVMVCCRMAASSPISLHSGISGSAFLHSAPPLDTQPESIVWTSPHLSSHLPGTADALLAIEPPVIRATGPLPSSVDAEHILIRIKPPTTNGESSPGRQTADHHMNMVSGSGHVHLSVEPSPGDDISRLDQEEGLDHLIASLTTLLRQLNTTTVRPFPGQPNNVGSEARVAPGRISRREIGAEYDDDDDDSSYEYYDDFESSKPFQDLSSLFLDSDKRLAGTSVRTSSSRAPAPNKSSSRAPSIGPTRPTPSSVTYGPQPKPTLAPSLTSTPSSLQTLLSSHQIRTNFLKTPSMQQYLVTPDANAAGGGQDGAGEPADTDPHYFQTMAESFYTRSRTPGSSKRLEPKIGVRSDVVREADGDEDDSMIQTAVIALKLSSRILDLYKTVSPYLSR